MTSPAKGGAPPRQYSFWAGLLSYLVPGLGQIVQGRVGKGVLFMVCVYALFFYGMYQGSGSVHIAGKDRLPPVEEGKTYTISSNVYLPDRASADTPFNLPPLAANLYERPQFLGQFWAGVVAWPAIWQYLHSDRDLDKQIDELRLKGATAEEIEALEKRKERGGTIFGRFQREPPEETVNAVHNAGDKRMELAWVFTVIAGVLNILVIYDAVAGPAFVAVAGAKAPEPAKAPKPQTA
jgi:hypothetical protein